MQEGSMESPTEQLEFDTGTPEIALKGGFLPGLEFTLIVVLAHREWISFLAAGTVLCFGFSTRVMLITLRGFNCCWAMSTLNQGLTGASCSANDVHKMLGEGHSWESWPELAKGMLQGVECHTKLGSAQLLLRDRLGVSQWVVSNGSVHQLFLLVWFFSIPPFCYDYYILLCFS